MNRRMVVWHWHCKCLRTSIGLVWGNLITCNLLNLLLLSWFEFELFNVLMVGFIEFYFLGN